MDLVLGVDQAMRNTGWQLIQVPQAMQGDEHKAVSLKEGGTWTEDDTDKTELDRLIVQAKVIHDIIKQYKPTVVVLENALSIGQDRSPSGLALYCLILAPLRESKLADDFASVKQVISIRPERLNSLAHNKRSVPGSEVVRAFKDKTGHQKRVTHHQADAYFLAYYGVRFMRTCLQNQWPQTILTPKERSIFLESTKEVTRRVTKDEKAAGKKGPQKTGEIENTGMLHQKDYAWWNWNAPTSI
jgi:hypothetical protein